MTAKRLATWRGHSEKYGLRSNPADLENEVNVYVQFEGVVQDIRVRQKRLLEQHNALQSWALFELPMDLGLMLREASLLSKWTGLTGSREVTVGDEAFDRAVALYGDEPERVRALMTPEVRAHVQKLHDSGLTYKIADNRIFVHRSGCHDSANDWSGDLHLVLDTAKAFEEARRKLPVASALKPFEAAWRDVAVEHGLTLALCPLSVSGTLGSTKVAAFTERVAQKRYEVALRVIFDTELGAPFEVRARRAVDSFTDLVQGGWVSTGDARFDHEFHVFGSAAVTAALDEEVRHHLLHLAEEQGHVVLTERELTVRAGSVDAPGDLPRMLKTVDEMAKHLRQQLGRSLRPAAAPPSP